MKRRLKPTVIAITAAAIVWNTFSPLFVGAVNYQSSDSAQKMLAIQYRFAMFACLNQSGGIFKDAYDSNALPDIAGLNTFDYSGNTVAGEKIVPDSGTNISCDNVLEGNSFGSKNFTGGGAYQFFGLTELAEDVLWADVFGYTKSGKSGDLNNQQYTFSATVNVGEQSGVKVTNTVALQ